MTALMIAAEAGGTAGLGMTCALITAGCNATLTDKVGMTALHHGCYVGALNVVRYLLERVLPDTTLTPPDADEYYSPLPAASSSVSVIPSAVVAELLNVQVGVCVCLVTTGSVMDVQACSLVDNPSLNCGWFYIWDSLSLSH